MINSLPWTVTEDGYEEIVNLVEKAQFLNPEDNQELIMKIDDRINQIVYEMYGLSSDEKEMIEKWKKQ